MALDSIENQPIKRIINPHTDKIWDDDGYDTLPVEECEEPMVEIGEWSEAKGSRIKAYPVYEGFDYYNGERDPKRALPGGTGSTGTYLRESVAEGLLATDIALRKRGKNLVVTDGWRSPERQASGFTDTIITMLKEEGVTKGDIAGFLRTGLKAKGFFSPIQVDQKSTEYLEFERDLMATPTVMEAMQTVSAETQKSPEELLGLFIRFCGNVEAVRKHFPNAPATLLNIQIPFDFENSTHPTGGSVDMLIESEGQIATPSGFDFFGTEGQIDALEQLNFPDLQARYLANPVLRTHCKSQFGIEPEQLTERHYELIKGAMRALFHISDRAGASHYLDELQHKQFGNIIRNPETGTIIHRGRMAEKHPNAGNTCHSIQTMTHNRAVGIYGGNFALRNIEKQFGNDKGREI